MFAAIRQSMDMETAKVLAVTSAPFLVWGSNLELGLKIATAAGACLYVWIKVWRLHRKGG
jgi:hypothetical protein